MASNEIAAELLRHLARAGCDRGDRPLGLQTRLLDGTVDSLTLIELIAFVEAAFGIRVPHHDVVPDNFATVADLSRYVAAEQRRSRVSREPGPVAAE